MFKERNGIDLNDLQLLQEEVVEDEKSIALSMGLGGECDAVLNDECDYSLLRDSCRGG